MWEYKAPPAEVLLRGWHIGTQSFHSGKFFRYLYTAFWGYRALKQPRGMSCAGLESPVRNRTAHEE